MFNSNPATHVALARGMGFYDESEPNEFLEKYLSVKDLVRGYFRNIIGDID